MANSETTLTLKKQTEATWGNETVSVASKMSTPFVLQLHRKVRRVIQAHGGQIEEFIYEPIPGTASRPTSFVVNGTGYIKRPGDAGGEYSAGYAITNNIPKQFWEEWYSQYQTHDAIKNNMLFAHSEKASVTAMSKEHESEKSGMERLDPKNLPKFGKTDIENSDRNRV